MQRIKNSHGDCGTIILLGNKTNNFRAASDFWRSRKILFAHQREGAMFFSRYKQSYPCSCCSCGYFIGDDSDVKANVE